MSDLSPQSRPKQVAVADARDGSVVAPLHRVVSSLHCMTPKRRVTWQATLDAENS
jgi:hypothetical protein